MTSFYLDKINPPEGKPTTTSLSSLADEMADALRPQLSPKARKLVEETIDALDTNDDDDARLAGALEFLLTRQDTAWPIVARYDGYKASRKGEKS